MTHINANVPVTDNLLSRFRFTSYNSIVEARIMLAQQIRLSMQYPQTYNIPIDQQLPPDIGVESIAQYVHPWNVACALVNVCLNGPRFGGAELAPQEDLQLYAADWAPLGSHSFPTAVVPMGVPETQPAPVQAAPAPAPPPVAPPAPEPQQAPPAVTGELMARDSEPAPPERRVESPAALGAGYGPETPEGGNGLPDTDIRAERRGQSGRPQKSPFEKKIEERNKIAPPPFWWTHLIVSAPWIFTRNPAGALDDSSTGAGPVQSYMVLLALLRRVLQETPGHVTVDELRKHLQAIDTQVSRLETSAAANQLRAKLVPAPKK